MNPSCRATDPSEPSRPRVLVTGAAVRVGRAVCRALAADGWAVAAHYHRSRGDADALAAETGADLFGADLSSPGGPEGLAAAVCASGGPPAALVNNAALFEHDRVGGFDPNVFERMMAMNVRQALALTDALLAQAEAAGADRLDVIHVLDQKIVNVSDRNLSYTLSKTALAAAMRLQNRRDGGADLRVNAVAPGILLRSGRQTDAEFQMMARENPLRRPPSLENVADTVRFLLRARSARGQVIFVDGGLHLQRSESGEFLT